jgi:hypothetical protein
MTDAIGGLGPAIFAAIYVCVAWIAWRTSRFIFPRKENALWRGTCVTLIALGANRLLEGTLSNIGRTVAFDQGWYGERQALQIGVVTGIVVFFSLATIIWLVILRRATASSWLVLFGIMMLIAFALVRDVSLHQIDQIIGERIFGFKLNWLLELGGLGLVVLASAWRSRDQNTRTDRRRSNG